MRLLPVACASNEMHFVEGVHHSSYSSDHFGQRGRCLDPNKPKRESKQESVEIVLVVERVSRL
jgi:hypothetical protein